MATTTYTQQLIDDYEVKKERIALETGATVRTVERWYRCGEIRPIPHYQEKLRRFLERKKHQDNE